MPTFTQWKNLKHQGCIKFKPLNLAIMIIQISITLQMTLMIQKNVDQLFHAAENK